MDWIHLIAAPAVSAFIGAVVAACVSRIKSGYSESRDGNRAEREGILALLRCKLTEAHMLHVDREMPLSLYERENIVRVHQAYHDLGGNDIGDKAFKEIMDLPISD